MSDRTRNDGQIVWGICGTALLLLAWEVVGRNQLAGLTWPPLTRVVAFSADPRNAELLGRAIYATALSALCGYGIGVGLGSALGMLAHLVPALANGLSRGTAVINAIPSIALAPVFSILLSRSSTPAAVASLHVVFIAFVAMNSGLKASTPAHGDMMVVFGANALRRFLLLEGPNAMPAIASGLRLAAPVSIIGAIIGEWFGSDRGLGVLIVSAMQNFQIELLWSASLAASIFSLVLYTMMTLMETIIYRTFR